MRIIIFSFLLSCPLLSQNSLDERQIEHVFNLLGTGEVERAISYVEEQSITPYDFGRDLLIHGQAEKAIKWYQQLAIEKNEHQYLYGAAYAQWKMGDTEGALQDAVFILSSNPPPLIEARTNYLLGHVCMDARKLEEAEAYFKAGLSIYRSLGNKQGGEYLCLTMLAAVAVYKKDYNNVPKLLQQALEANQHVIDSGMRGHSMGTYYEILGEMHFWKGEYSEALTANLKSYEAFLGEGKTAWAQGVEVKIGLLHFLTGHPKKAYDIATGILEDVRGKKDKGRIAAYNNVTLMFIAFCANLDDEYTLRRGAALKWADHALGGEDLRRLLNLEFTCPPIEE